MKQNLAEITTIGFISLGCPKNTVDSERMLAQIAQSGFAITAEIESADIVIVNTCGFIAPAKDEAIDTINEALGWKKAKSVKKVIVTGCLAQRMGDDLLKKCPGIDAIVGLGQRDDIAAILEETLKKKKPKTYLEHHDNFISDDRVRMLTTEGHWAYLRISEGCDHGCSFCTIPAIRGRFRSKQPRMIIEEARELADCGVTELNIIAQDTTSYGRDIGLKDGLANLLTDLHRAANVNWIRLMYLYPFGITDALIETIASSKRIVNYLDMPIQHINDEILQKMRRPENKRMIKKLIEKLRCSIPDIVLRTTVIVGFPGETDDQFKELLHFIEDMQFDALGCFRYYPEKGTDAARMPDQIPEGIKDQRVDQLMLAQQQIAFAKNDRMVGKELTCLVESFNDDGTATGRYYGQAPEIDSVCIVKRCTAPAGRFIKTKVTATKDYDLLVEQI